ncbi:MAG: hypothetical protein U1A27_08240 [Phycisphaerae bacterium]
MIDETTEILINRLIDGELSPAERAVLEARLASDATARQLVEEYRALDARAAAALRHVVVRAAQPGTALAAASVRRRASQRRILTWAGVSLGAAAAVALSVSGIWRRSAWLQLPSNGGASVGVANVEPTAPTDLRPRVWRPLSPNDIPPAAWGLPTGRPTPQFVDYVPESSLHPNHRQTRNTRDVIGITNEAGDRIYLLEQNTRQARVRPLSREF